MPQLLLQYQTPRNHNIRARRGKMSYATRACSQLTAATSIRRLLSYHGNGLNRVACHPSSFARGLRVWRWCSPYAGSRYFTSSPHRTRDYIQEESARETNEKDQHAHEKEVEDSIQEATKQQIKRPWQREGADIPPAEVSHRSMNKTMAKGNLSSA